MKNTIKYILLLLVLAVMITGCGKKEAAKEPTPQVVADQKPANLLTVCKDGSCDYNSISAAIDAAKEGYTVKITDKGTYSMETITFANSGITVDCQGAIMDGEGLGAAFFIKELSNVKVKNCVINNYAHGVSMDKTSNSEISGNKISDAGLGIYMTGSDNNAIKNNEVIGAKEGISMYVCSGNTVESNTVTKSVATGITDTNSLTGNMIQNNIVSENTKIGIWIKSQNTAINGNKVTNNGYYGILCDTDTATISGNTCSGNQKDQCKGCTAASCTEIGC